MNKEKLKGIIIGITLSLVMSFALNTVLADAIRKDVKITFNGIKIFIDGVKITPKDANGEVVEPFILNGTTYLPVRAIGEGLKKEVNWDRATQTVYIGDMPKIGPGDLGLEAFMKKHPKYKGYESSIDGPGIVMIRQEPFNYSNKMYFQEGTYLIKGNYSKLKGLLIFGDNGEGAYTVDRFGVMGDGEILFDAREYCRSLGIVFERGVKNQPIPFEIDLTGIEELSFTHNGTYTGNEDKTLYNIEFIEIGK